MKHDIAGTTLKQGKHRAPGPMANGSPKGGKWCPERRSPSCPCHLPPQLSPQALIGNSTDERQPRQSISSYRHHRLPKWLVHSGTDSSKVEPKPRKVKT